MSQEARRLECYVTRDGKTCCMECATRFTGSRPVALLPPRKCFKCGKTIIDPWPQESES